MLGTITFLNKTQRINAEEVNYWKRMVKSNFKVGVEIETCIDNSIDESRVIRELSSAFMPTDDYGNFGVCGVVEIGTDGSLDNGIELATIGRRLSFIDLYNQYSTICNAIFEFSPDMNQRAGLHNHFLLDYGSGYNCLEKPLPGIIMKNFIQLIRRHLPELVWISSTVNPNNNEHNSITRMEDFCTANTLLRNTPIGKTISEYKNALDDGGYAGRYKFINLRPMEITDDEIKKLHYELRFPDGSIFPAQMAALNILYASMFVKAIELSELGIISTGGEELWEETKTLYNSLRNHIGERLSQRPTDVQIERIKERCKIMIKEFKPQICDYDKHIYPILNILAETPISIMRSTAESDEKLNEQFDDMIANMFSTDITDCENVTEAILLNKILGSFSEENYIHTLAKELNEDPTVIKNKLFKLKEYKNMYFDAEIGSYVFA